MVLCGQKRLKQTEAELADTMEKWKQRVKEITDKEVELEAQYLPKSTSMVHIHLEDML